MKKFVLLAVVMSVLMVAVGCSQNSKKNAPGSAGSNAQPIVATNADRNVDVVLPELAAAYQGVVMRVIDLKTEFSEDILVPFSTPTQMGKTPLVVTVVQFFPDFAITDQGFSSKSMEPNNVGAKVHVTGDKRHFNGWLFANFPDIHPYDSDDYSLIVVEAVKK
jgi:outer membrane murein-binding lipoprotein Lpp